MTVKQDEEHMLVGAMLSDDTARAQAMERGINQYVLHDKTLARVVQGLADMDEAGYPTDVVVLSRHLSKGPTTISVEYLNDLARLFMERGSLSAATLYADMVIEDYRARKAWHAASDIINQIRQDPDTDVQEELARALMVMQPEVQKPRGGWYADVIPRYLDHLEERWSGLGEKEYTETPHPALNKLLRGGFYNGELVFIGARPGAGKTVMALDIAHHAAKQGKRVAFFSAEMSVRAMMRRAAAEFTAIPTFIADHPGPLADHQQEMRERYVRSVRDDLSKLPIYIDDRSNPTIPYINDCIDRLKDIGMVVVDYIGLMGDTGKSATERMDAIALGLQRMAKDHNIPVVALSQLSRAVEQNKPYRPSLTHLRDSGQIEANAHVVLLLYRKQYYINQGMLDDDGSGADIMDIMVAKNRESDTGVVRLKFDGPTFRLKELD